MHKSEKITPDSHRGFRALNYLCGRKVLMRNYFLFLSLFALATSCIEPTDCISKRNNLVGINFKSFQNGKVSAQSIDSAYSDSGEIIFLKGAATEKALLPLNYLTDSTSYTIVIADTVYTVTFKYNSKVEFVNEQCGERYIISNLQVTNDNFDSLQLISATPSADGKTINIEIFN